MEGVILANPELHRARPVESVVPLEVLYDVQQQVGSLDLDTYRVVCPAKAQGNKGGHGAPPWSLSTWV